MCFYTFLKSFFRWGDVNLISENCRPFARVAQKMLAIDVQVDGLEHLETGRAAVYVMNHQSMLDIIHLGGFFPRNTVIIGKKELKFFPFLGMVLASTGNIFINRRQHSNSLAGLSRAVEEMRARGASVLIFPEGTRNRTRKGLLPFKKGAFHMAISAQAPVIAIVCQPLARVFSKQEHLLGNCKVRLRILPPLAVA
ncbi:MAG: lysophospholipid acyltransferase family protein, partial [Bdellovibrionota bacterium]